MAEQPELGVQAAEFLANTLCHLGFAHVTTVGFTSDLGESLYDSFLTKFKHLTSSAKLKVRTLHKPT